MYGSLIIPLSPDSAILLNRGAHVGCVSVMLFPPSVVRVRKDRDGAGHITSHPVRGQCPIMPAPSHSDGSRMD